MLVSKSRYLMKGTMVIGSVTKLTCGCLAITGREAYSCGSGELANGIDPADFRILGGTTVLGYLIGYRVEGRPRNELKSRTRGKEITDSEVCGEVE